MDLTAEMPRKSTGKYDVVIIGSGFGGCMSAIPLVEAGLRVLMVERGGWVERGAENWGEQGVFVLTPHYTTDGALSIRTVRGWRPQGICACVGGPSVFYGGASFRFREADFEPPPEIAGSSAAEWPIGYDDLEPYYCRAEALLGVAGEAGRDPTEPRRSQPYPQVPLPSSTTGVRFATAAAELGMRPFRIPMAIDAGSCRACNTCDAFACAVEAKNDLATRVIPMLVEAGMELLPGTIAARIEVTGRQVRAIDAVDRRTGQRRRIEAGHVVLAAGALATPQIVLGSELGERNPGRAAIGRYLMRHCNAMMYGYFPDASKPLVEHHKQIAIHDFYFGDPDRPHLGKLGNLQQVMTPPASLVRAMLPAGVGAAMGSFIHHLTGMLAIAEDQPRAENGIAMDLRRRDRHGLPAARIHHQYSTRDVAARAALLRRARQLLKRSGALFTLTWRVNTFSHALGTMRMGRDPASSPVDDACRFRGLDNLWVADGSVFPTSGGVNPSLTIAANALRVGTGLAAAA